MQCQEAPVFQTKSLGSQSSQSEEDINFPFLNPITFYIKRNKYGWKWTDCSYYVGNSPEEV